MVEQERLAGIVRSAAIEVFHTMLGQDLQALPPRMEPYVLSQSGILAFSGIAGEMTGTCGFSCSTSLACRIADSLYLTPHRIIDDEALEAVAELMNTILSNARAALEEKSGSLLLTIPTVIHGRPFSSRSLNGKPWLVLPFEAEGERIEISLCITSGVAGQYAGLRPRRTHSLALHV